LNRVERHALSRAVILDGENQMSDGLKDRPTLILSSELPSKNILPERYPRGPSENTSAAFTLLLTYDQNIFRFVPKGNVKVAPFKVLSLEE